jgi:hypothetical protein
MSAVDIASDPKTRVLTDGIAWGGINRAKVGLINMKLMFISLTTPGRFARASFGTMQRQPPCRRVEKISATAAPKL